MEGCEIFAIASYFRENYIGEIFLSFHAYASPKGNNRYEKELNNDFDCRNQLIIDVRVKGKHIFFQLQNGLFIHIHYGLNGYLRSKPDSNIRYVIKTTFWLPIYYCDTNNYGYIEFIDKKKYQDIINNKLSVLDPFIKNTFNHNNIRDLFNRLQKSKLSIGEILINQKYVLGLGLYLRSEILYMKLIHPLTLAKNISYEKLYDLLSTIYAWLPFFSSLTNSVLIDVFIRSPLFNLSKGHHYSSYFNSINYSLKQNNSSSQLMKKFFFRIHMHDCFSIKIKSDKIIKLKIK